MLSRIIWFWPKQLRLLIVVDEVIAGRKVGHVSDVDSLCFPPWPEHRLGRGPFGAMVKGVDDVARRAVLLRAGRAEAPSNRSLDLLLERQPPPVLGDEVRGESHRENKLLY